MHLAVLNLTGGGLSGGYVKYLGRMLPMLGRDPRIERLSVLMPPGVGAPSGVGVDTLSWPPGDGRTGYRTLRRRLRQLAPDVVFIPTARWLDCGPIPTVVMVRNMEPLTVPFGGNSLVEGIRNLMRARIARMACRRASRIVAVSQYVHEFLTIRWRIRPDKVGLIYHGVDAWEAEPTLLPATRSDRLVQEPFVLTAGSIRPARGLEDVIRATGRLGRLYPSLRLVIAGQADRATVAYERRMRALAEAQGAGRVVWTGQLAPSEMVWYFRQCAAYVMTSRAEACPNTVLEAMSHGSLTVSTRQPPMPEFFADAALYYHPGDDEGLAAQIMTMLAASPEECATRREALRNRARRFQWRETADRTIQLLTLAAAGVATLPVCTESGQGSKTGGQSP
jgi:glycosyltransferase involved in cell wall biosynthesis